MNLFRNLPTAFWFCSILIFTILMLQIVLPYLSWEWDIDFLQTKQAIIHLFHYRSAFYLHIFSSCLVLFSGAFLFPKVIIKKFSTLHRWAGKIYVLLLLLVSAPSGAIMAFYANGGWPAKTSFLILCPLWWYCTYMGYRKIRQKKIKEHEVWMIRSYALTLSAISLRFYQMILGNTGIFDPDTFYVIVSWISWLGNLLVAEVWVRSKKNMFRLKSFVDYKLWPLIYK